MDSDGAPILIPAEHLEGWLLAGIPHPGEIQQESDVAASETGKTFAVVIIGGRTLQGVSQASLDGFVQELPSSQQTLGALRARGCRALERHLV